MILGFKRAIVVQNEIKTQRHGLIHYGNWAFLSPVVTSSEALLSYRTQQELAAQTVTKAEFRSSQTYEFEAIKKIIPVVQAKGIYSCTICHVSRLHVVLSM